MRRKRVQRLAKIGTIELICLYDTKTTLLYGLKSDTIDKARIDAVSKAKKEKLPIDRCMLSVWRVGMDDDELIAIAANAEGESV